MKRKGDRGSPYLRPWEGDNFPWGEPSIKTENETVKMHCLIRWVQEWLKPKAKKNFERKFYSIKSKAFSMSNLIAIGPPLPFLFFMEWKISWARMEFS
jgi:hypothetical protein